MDFPVTGLPSTGMESRVLVVGDPARAELVSTHLDNPSLLAANREYHSYQGAFEGAGVAVVSHGVGAAGAGVCFAEIIKAGAKKVIRAGTCGGLQDSVGDGDLVIASAAVRDDGHTNGLVPIEFPAFANPTITHTLSSLAPAAHLGVVLSSAVFYPSDVLGSKLALWQRARCIAVEMECAALFVACSLAGIEAGAILTVDGNPLADADESMEGYNPDRTVVKDAVDQMIGLALRALVTRSSS